MSLILREGPSFYDFQVFVVPPFCSPCDLSFWFIIYSSLFIPLPFLLILLNLILKDENPKAVAGYVSSCIPHPIQSKQGYQHTIYSLRSALLCVYSSQAKGDMSVKGGLWASSLCSP